VPGETRAVEDIRAEIAIEREQLEQALGDLRASAEAKRRPATFFVGALAATLAALMTAKVVRRLRGD